MIASSSPRSPHNQPDVVFQPGEHVAYHVESTDTPAHAPTVNSSRVAGEAEHASPRGARVTWLLLVIVAAALSTSPLRAQDLVTVAASNTGGTVSGGGTVTSGDRVTVTSTPSAGSYFVNWTENGSLVSTAARYTFSVPFPPVRATRSLVANFDSNINPTIQVTAVGSGTFTGGGALHLGTIATVTATAANGSRFVGWSENGTIVSAASPYSFTVTVPRALVANFTTIDPAPLTIILRGGDYFVPLGIWSTLAVNPIVTGGMPPYRYAWSLVNASVSQSEVPTFGGITYGANAVVVDVIGSDAAVNTSLYKGPRNPISLTVTDSAGATASVESDHIFLSAPDTGPIDPRPGWRMYSYVGASHQPQRFSVYIPPSYDPATPMPLLVDINKRGIPSVTEFMPYADTMGFAIIGFPDMGLDNTPDRDGTMMSAIDRLICGKEFHGRVAIDRTAVLAVGLSGGVPYGVWTPAGQHPEIFTALASQSGNYFDNRVDPAFATRPILLQWAEDDRATILQQTPGAISYFRDTLHCIKLTTVLVPAGQGGHTSHTDRVIAWWTPYLPQRAVSIYRQPQSRTVMAGQSADFKVMATGVPAATYQWQMSRDGTTWSTATGSSVTAIYHWGLAALANSGLRLRCVVSNSGGSAMSAAATLTVLAAETTQSHQ